MVFFFHSLFSLGKFQICFHFSKGYFSYLADGYQVNFVFCYTNDLQDNWWDLWSAGDEVNDKWCWWMVMAKIVDCAVEEIEDEDWTPPLLLPRSKWRGPQGYAFFPGGVKSDYGDAVFEERGLSCWWWGWWGWWPPPTWPCSHRWQPLWKSAAQEASWTDHFRT